MFQSLALSSAVATAILLLRPALIFSIQTGLPWKYPEQYLLLPFATDLFVPSLVVLRVDRTKAHPARHQIARVESQLIAVALRLKGIATRSQCQLSNILKTPAMPEGSQSAFLTNSIN